MSAKSSQPNTPTGVEVPIRIGARNVTLKQTQRSQYRISKTINLEDFQIPSRQFALFCDLVLCLDTSPKPAYSPEDVAEAYFGKEEELVTKVLKAMGKDTDGQPVTEDATKKEQGSSGHSPASS